MTRLLFSFALVLSMLSACGSGPRGDFPIDPANFPSPDPNSQSVAPRKYVLSPSDEIRLTVFRVPDISGDYKIDQEGFLSLPLLEPFSVITFNTRELADHLKNLYGEKYLHEPDITVQIEKAQGQIVTIEGAVKKAGIYTVEGSTTLLGAMAIAGGVDLETALTDRIIILRTIDNERYAAVFDLRKVREGLQSNPDIFGGDIVVVAGSNRRRDLLDILRAVPALGLFYRTF